MDVKEETVISLKKGLWSSQEDSLLVNYIAIHGEGSWNYVARNSGLNRTGKSCRLRWKNYLQPNVRRGNFTVAEQLRIAELHCLYGNRWSKIAEFLPGRTDNEIKNYWRTQVHKRAKQLEYDTNGVELREFVRDIWLPTLSQQIHASHCNNNNLGNITTMNHHDGSEALQMDYRVNGFLCEADQVKPTDHEFEFYDQIAFESDFQQQYFSDSSAWFSYGELSNI